MNFMGLIVLDDLSFEKDFWLKISAFPTLECDNRMMIHKHVLTNKRVPCFIIELSTILSTIYPQ